MSKELFSHMTETRTAIVLSMAMGLGFVATAGVSEATAPVHAPEVCFIGEEQEFPGPKNGPSERILPPKHRPGPKNHLRAFR